MRVFIALLPILSIIGSMALLNLGTVLACTLGLAVAVGLGVWSFGLRATSVIPYLIHGSFSSWDLVLLIAGGSLMGALLTANGTTTALSAAFAEETVGPTLAGSESASSEKPVTRLLLAGTCLGVIPAVSAMIGPGAYFVGLPLLISLGVSAERAIPVFLLSQSWGLANFTFGLPCTAMSTSTGIPAPDIARWSGIPMVPLIVVIAFMLRALLPELRSVAAAHFAIMTGAVICGVLLGSLLGPAFPTLLGGISGAAASMVLQGGESTFRRLRAVPARGVLPVLIVAVHSVLIRIPQIKLAAGALAWSVSTPVGPVKFDIAGSSGAVLLVSSLVGCLSLSRDNAEKCLKTTLRSWRAMAVAPLAMSLTDTMSAAGMVTEIVRATTSLGKTAFVACLPLIGMLGHYLTGSLVSGSLIVGRYIADLAPVLGLTPALAASAALVGGAPIVAIIPSKIAMACAAVQYTGGQKSIVRKGIFAMFVSWVVVSLVVLAFAV